VRVVPALPAPLLDPDAADLRQTVETYLDLGGDAQATMAALHVSRAGSTAGWPVPNCWPASTCTTASSACSCTSR
jgi:hypothetical protein